MRSFAIKLLALLTTTTLISVCLTGVASAAVPTVPTNLSATAGNKSVVLTWTASSNSPTDYVIEYSPGTRVLTGLVTVIEPTPNAPWIRAFRAYYDAEKPLRSKAAGLRYGGLLVGDPYHHHGLCRYKVAFDVLGDVPLNEIDFRNRVC